MPESRRGRARSESTRQAILAATRDELAISGYDKLSIDRIAAAAGAGKQTVYRWYASKNALIADCVLSGYLVTEALVVADTGEARLDLGDWLHELVDHANQPRMVALIRASTAAAAEDEEVAAKLYERVTATAEAALSTRLAAAVRAGQLPAGYPVEVGASALFGAVLYRILTRQPITLAFVDDLLDAVLREPQSSRTAPRPE
jgi:AcrR family transcriptional regulator